MRRGCAWLILLLCATGCAFLQRGDHFGARPVGFDQLSGWQDDDHAEALKVFLASCPKVAGRPSSTGSGLSVPPEVWQSLCEDAARVPAGDDAQALLFFQRRFTPYRIANNGKEQGLFTGYYVPVLYGSRRKHGDYIYPLYLPPPELASQRPYLTHADINSGALAHRGLELVWVDDPVMRFFLQIQGSGVVKLSKRQEMLIGYAGGNGQPYVSLGKMIGDEGLMPKDQINFFTLRQYLYDHSDQAFPLMEHNPSYVFFKPLETAEVVGAVGVPLMRQRSLAVDNHYIPYGLPLFLETSLPAMPGRPESPFHRLMVAQDTGGAIRGPVRGDIFFGRGQEAEYLAGYMKGRGVYTLLVPKEIAEQMPKP